MKYLLLLSFVICFGGSVTAQEQTGLDELEFNTAVKLYKDMVKTQDYLDYKENINLVVIKLNGADCPADLHISDKDAIKSWMSKNIEATKFMSVEEGVTTMHQSYLLMEKLHQRNKRLYDLMRKASRNQLRVIIAPEFKRLY